MWWWGHNNWMASSSARGARHSRPCMHCPGVELVAWLCRKVRIENRPSFTHFADGYWEALTAHFPHFNIVIAIISISSVESSSWGSANGFPFLYISYDPEFHSHLLWAGNMADNFNCLWFNPYTNLLVLSRKLRLMEVKPYIQHYKASGVLEYWIFLVFFVLYPGTRN